MQSVEIGPVPAGERTQSAADLFLIFAGANIVATTLQVGATLAPAFRVGNALVLIALGSLAGALLAWSSRRSARGWGCLPSSRRGRRSGMRAPPRGPPRRLNCAGSRVSNVIAAPPARAPRRTGLRRIWAACARAREQAIVAGGPRAVALADRYAVPLLAVVGSSSRSPAARFLRRRCRAHHQPDSGAAASTSSSLAGLVDPDVRGLLALRRLAGPPEPWPSFSVCVDDLWFLRWVLRRREWPARTIPARCCRRSCTCARTDSPRARHPDDELRQHLSSALGKASCRRRARPSRSGLLESSAPCSRCPRSGWTATPTSCCS
jgi:hypothetical protein